MQRPHARISIHDIFHKESINIYIYIYCLAVICHGGDGLSISS